MDFKSEVDIGLQTLFAYFAFHSVAYGKPAILSRLNVTPVFWNTTMYSLQCTYFITLGRVFDNKSPHNPHRLIRLCQESRDIFSKEALAARKRKGSENADEWLQEYLSHVYVPRTEDFRRLRKKITEYQKRYENVAKDIRNKVFAHKEVTDRMQVAGLFSKLSVGDLKRIYLFLTQLHQALFDLYHNGRKPVLKQQRYSIERFLKEERDVLRGTSTQEMIVKEVKRLLTEVISN